MPGRRSEEPERRHGYLLEFPTEILGGCFVSLAMTTLTMTRNCSKMLHFHKMEQF